MANHRATGKKTKHGPELAQRCRAAVLNAFEVFEKRTGKLISEVLADELENNPFKFMELASKFCPRDIEAEVTHIMEADKLTDDELADIAAGSRTRAAGPAGGKKKPARVH